MDQSIKTAISRVLPVIIFLNFDEAQNKMFLFQSVKWHASIGGKTFVQIKCDF